MRRSLVLFAAVLLTADSPLARTWHILPDGSGDAPTIQAGIDSAAAGDTVSLSCGVYVERNIHMKSGVCLRSATGDPTCATIDARGVGRVLIGEVVDNQATIEGLTLTGGHAEGSHPDHHGGGVFLQGSSPLIRNCVLTENRADWLGGGIVCYLSASPRVEACVFRSNRAYRGAGAGIYNSSPQFVDCVFEENQADNWGGGALAGEDSFGSFRRCVFLNNSAQGNGGGVRAFDNSTGFIECTFRGNSTQGQGGGILFLQCNGPRSRLIDCIVTENRAAKSGGVRVDRSTTLVQNCEISRNEAQQIGGGIHFYEDADTQMEGCLVFGNRAPVGGGVVAELISDPVIRNCTIYGNAGTVEGGGLYSYRGSDPQIENTILALSAEGEAVSCVNQSTATLQCANVYGNAGGDWVGCIADQHGQNGNFSADPLFCDPENGDFTLCADSPCAAAAGCGLVGAFGIGCDACGEISVEHTTWGGIKSLFR